MPWFYTATRRNITVLMSYTVAGAQPMSKLPVLDQLAYTNVHMRPARLRGGVRAATLSKEHNVTAMPPS